MDDGGDGLDVDAVSFPFGILAQMFRGWRWRQSLEPVGEHPRFSVSIHAIFLSYAASLVIPRVGEFTRCGVLKRYDNISFAKALGTVVTERAIDSLLVMGIAAIVLLLEMSTYLGTFFRKDRNQSADLPSCKVSHGQVIWWQPSRQSPFSSCCSFRLRKLTYI